MRRLVFVISIFLISFSIKAQENLDTVTISVSEGYFIGTTAVIEFSIDTLNSGWTVCDDDTTVFAFPDSGNYKVFVRDAILTDSIRLIRYVPRQEAAPVFSVDYSPETLSPLPTDTIEYDWLRDFSGSIKGNGIAIDLQLDLAPRMLYLRAFATDSTVASKIDSVYINKRPLAPIIGINFPTESTDIIIPDTMAFASDSIFSDGALGLNAPLSLLPDDTVYFRYIATTNSFKSDTSFLITPARLDTPAVVIDYTNELLTNVVGSPLWASSGAFVALSNNEPISDSIPTALSVDDTVYIYVPSDGSTFRSDTQLLVIPKRIDAPVISGYDDTGNNFTWTAVSGFATVSDYEYSTDAGSTWTDAENTTQSVGNINISAGDLLLRLKSSSTVGFERFHSEADTSTFTFNSTVALVLTGVDVRIDSAKLTSTSSAMEYSLTSTDGVDGLWLACVDGSTPFVLDSAGGFNVYVRQAADTTNHQLVKAIPVLAAPPGLGIDFTNEVTAVIPTTHEFAWLWDWSDKTDGTNATINLASAIGSRDSVVYIRIKASQYAVASQPQSLLIPARLDTPAVVIDYTNEILTNVVGSPLWASSGAFVALSNNEPISDSIPTSSSVDDTVYIYVPSDGSTFRSDTQLVVIPKRINAPVISGYDDTGNNFTWTTVSGFPTVSDYEFSIDAGSTWTVTDNTTQSVGNINISAGDLLLRLKSSSDVGFERFHSEADTSTFTFNSTVALVLTGVDVRIDSAKLTSTSSAMEYSLTSTDGVDGLWLACVDGSTPFVLDSAGGFNVYVRQAADTTNHQLVKAIPVSAALPSLGIDFTNEVSDVIPTTHEFAWLSDWSDKTDGTNTTINLASAIGSRDSVVYIRIKASQYAVASQTQALPIPARPLPPVFGIDNVNEQTNVSLTSNVVWSLKSDMSDAQNGTNAPLALLPDTSYYFQYLANVGSAFASEISSPLITPSRLPLSFSINYVDEETQEIVTTDVQFATNALMIGASSGSGSAIPLTPGTDVWFKKDASGTFFASDTFYLEVPARPAAPLVDVDFVNETVTNVPVNCIWDVTGSFTSVLNNASLVSYIPNFGDANKIVNFKIAAGASFESLSQTLTFDARADAPLITAYEDVAEPNTFTWTPLAGFSTATDYEYQYDGINWISCLSTTQTLPTNVAISTGQLKLRLKANDAVNRFSGMERTSTYAYSAASAINLTGVGVNVSSKQITNTTTSMEYSLNGSAGPWFSASTPNTTVTFDGSGGFDVYVRQTNLSDNVRLVASVPSASSEPIYDINYALETTDIPIAVGDEYSWDSDMSGAIAGDGVSRVPLNPGSSPKTLYIRTAATAVKVASAIQSLSVPARSATVSYELDYVAENTKTIVPSTVEWAKASDMSGAQSGSDARLNIQPATSYYFRVKSGIANFKSDITSLTVPARPIISFDVNYITEQTVQIIATNVEYDDNNGFTSPLLGTGASVSLIPGTTMYFRKKAVPDADLTSEPFELTVANRPSIPAASIDYEAELITNVPATCQWNVTGLFAPLSNNTSITSFIPDYGVANKTVSLYIPATTTTFKSLNQDVLIPAREQAPSITAYEDVAEPNTFTWTRISGFSALSSYEYNYNNIGWQTCSSLSQTVPTEVDIPAGALLLRLKASNSSSRFSGMQFASTTAFVGSAAIDLSGVGVNIALGQITNTTSSMAYSLNGTSGPWVPASNGNTTVLFNANGGFSVYVRQISLPGNMRLVRNVALAASAPTYGVNYFNETTSTAVALGDEYAWTSDFSAAIAGDGSSPVSLSPESSPKILYLRTAATATALASKTQALSIKARPASVSFSLNYVSESTSASVPTSVEWSLLSDMSGAQPGTGSPQSLQPNNTYYFRVKATSSSFSSVKTTVSVPSRPNISFNVDYINERTLQPVPTGVIYDENSAFSSPTNGTGLAISLSPGTNLWFKQEAVAGVSLASSVYGLTVPSRPGIVNYSIDYINERTSQIIPNTVEWATQSNMVGAQTGTGNTIVLESAKTYYFRVKASGSSFASENTQLSVPSRPVLSFNIDYINERTLENVSATIKYDDNSSFSSPDFGTGAPISVIPGQDVWLKQTALAGVSYASASYKLTVPVRPSSGSYSIDYQNEQTLGFIPSTVQWSNQSNMSGAQEGTGEKLPLSAGLSYYFRKKATASTFKSDVSSPLVIPIRPVISFSVDFLNERTNENVSSDYRWATNAALSGATSGTGTQLVLTPGQDIWFQKKAVDGLAYASLSYRLAVPARPLPVSFEIDYINEKTKTVVPTSVEWSNASNMSGAQNGTGTTIALLPLASYYFRVKASSSSFASQASSALVVPARPSINFSIDYVQEQTNQLLPNTIVWDDNASLTSPTQGTGGILKLTPGQDIWFQKPAIANLSYKSDVFYLNVNSRPSAPQFYLDYVNETTTLPVPSSVEWSQQSDMASAQSGLGVKLPVLPSTAYYFRTKATPTTFKSNVSAALLVPSRPVIGFTIDYANERTVETVNSSLIWAINDGMIGATQGNGFRLNLNPGQNIWFKQPAVNGVSLASQIFELLVPARPETPTVKINYNDELLYDVPAFCQWDLPGFFSDVSNNTSLSSYIPGYGSSNKSIFIRIKSTSSSFVSQIQQITLPSRNRAPSISAYDDISDPNTFSWNTIFGYADVNDYEFNINNTSWQQCVSSTQDIPADVQVLAGNLLLRLAASNTTGSERFAGEEVASVQTFSGTAPLVLGGVSINLLDSLITGTTSDMAYSLNSTNGIDGTWTSASDGNTSIIYNENGGFKVFIRQKSLIGNRRLVYDVAAKAPAPNYGIDFINETLNAPLSADDELTWNSNLSDFVSGDGLSKPALNVSTSGTMVYIRTALSQFAVASNVQYLVIPARETISYTIDYINETTNEIILSNIEYALNGSMFNSTNGLGNKLDLFPGQDLWFRKKATASSFASDIFKLAVKTRRIPTPNFTIDYFKETTAEIIPDSVEYDFMFDMNASVTGNGNAIAVEPGKSVYFRTKASVDKFSSEMFELAPPFRAQKPLPIIDYVNESITNIDTLCEWYDNGRYIAVSEGAPLSAFVPGFGQDSVLLPIRVKATATSFASNNDTITLSARPQAPLLVAYDDEADTLTWLPIDGFPLAENYEYSPNNGNTWITCDSFTVWVGDIQIPAGEFKLRLKGKNDGANSFFNGEPAVSTVDFIAIALLDFSQVKVNVSKGVLTGTSYGMSYSITSTDGVNGDWETALDDTTYISYPPEGGFKIFVRQKGKEVHFKEVHAVNVPRSAPEYTIDFRNELTQQSLTDRIEVSALPDMLDVSLGMNRPYTIVPGSTDTFIYIRIASDSLLLPSRIQQLYIPARPVSPVYSIDYIAELTKEKVTDSIEWASLKDMSDVQLGSGQRIALNPKALTDSLYFRTAATDTSFASDQYILEIPAKPEAPDVNINYEDELLIDVPLNSQWKRNGHYEYITDSLSIDTIIPDAGQLSLRIPVRYGPNDSTFASLDDTISIDARLNAPVFTEFNDGYDFFTWAFVDAFTDLRAYEITLNGGADWSIPTANTINVGNIDLNSGAIRIRIKGSNQAKIFKGAEAISSQSFTFIDLISLEGISADFSLRRLNGTNALMEYAVKQTGSPDSTWFTCDNIFTLFEYPAQGDFSIYVRQVGKASNFTQVLYVPEAADGPVYDIDFVNERIRIPINPNHEYAFTADMLNAKKGDSTAFVYINNVLDSTIYFRLAAKESEIASKITALPIPARPKLLVPINFKKEETAIALTEDMIYWRAFDMADTLRGTSVPLKLKPEDNWWFTKFASSTSFHTDTFKLVAPSRPAEPEFSIDFLNESTVEIVSDSIVWSMSSDMKDTLRAENDVVTLIPGRDMWFAYAATANSFSSLPFMLEVPLRPFKTVKPSIDFYNETLVGLDETMEVAIDDDVYRISGTYFDLSDIIKDNGAITLEARIQSDGLTRFASESQIVIVPDRPTIPFATLKHLVSDKGAVFVNDRRTRTEDGLEYMIDNGNWLPVEESTIIEIGGTKQVFVRKAATDESFKSRSTSNINFKLDAQLVDLIIVDGLKDSRLVIGGLQHFPENSIQIFSRWGNLIYEVNNYQNEFDFASYPAGTYYYLVTYTDEGVKKQFKNFVEVIKK